MPKINAVQAAILYKVTTRTVYHWIKKEQIKSYDGLYELDDLQDAYDKLPHRKRN
jgi:hypothetical protein